MCEREEVRVVRAREAPPPMDELETIQEWAQENVGDGDPNDRAKYQELIDSLDAVISDSRLGEQETPTTYGRDTGGAG